MATTALVDEDGAAEALRMACTGAGCPAGELVVWAWVFDAALEYVVLVDHPGFRLLLPPGGRVEIGERPQDAALRELAEETGLRPDRVHPTPALVDRVAGDFPDGTPFQTFGLAFVMEADLSTTLFGEPNQPPAWYPLNHPPPGAAAHHWRRIASHVGQMRRSHS